MKYSSVSVRQLETRKGKPWQANVKFKDDEGKWRQVSKMLTGAKGKREAQKLANEWLNELNEQYDAMPKSDKDKTLDEVYMSYVTRQLEVGEIEKSTHKNNIYYYRRYIKPYLGDYVFSTITNDIINGWLTKIYNSGLSQNTVHTVYALLKKVYNYFLENEELKTNPFKGVKMPKKGDAKVTHLTDKQIDDVLQAVYLDYTPKDAMYVGILLALYAGLRRGEICGLRWNDIDFKHHTLTVRSAIGVASECYTKNPKNKSSNRTFPMLPQLEQALKQRYDAIKPSNSWFVVGDKEDFLLPTRYNRWFSAFVDRNNLVDAYGNKIVPHGLRHNFATVGIRSGMDIASLALMMGHASRAMTLDTYGDANADALNMASAKLTDTFNRNTEYFKTDEEEGE